MEKRVLGRGLSALIQEKVKHDTGYALESKTQQGIIEIPIDIVHANQYQPREDFDEKALNDLTASIKEKGFIQPIVVRVKDDVYELIVGERRFRAAKKLGLKNIPAIIKDVSDKDSLELSIIENVQREQLNPIDQARAYNRLLDEFNMTQEDVAESIGKDRTTVANMVRLLKLPQKIQEYVSRGTLSMGHAMAVLSLDNKEAQHILANKVIKNSLSVRDAERYAKHMLESSRKTAPNALSRNQNDPNLIAVEESLRDIFGTKVRITKGKKGGSVEIEFYSDSDLDRVLTLLKSTR